MFEGPLKTIPIVLSTNSTNRGGGAPRWSKGRGYCVARVEAGTGIGAGEGDIIPPAIQSGAAGRRQRPLTATDQRSRNRQAA